MRATRRGIVKTSLVLAVGAPVVALARQVAPPDSTPGASPEASPGASPAASPAASSGEIVIEIIDFAFDPATIEVPVGTTVTWINGGQTVHTTVADDDAWASDVLQAGDSFSFTTNAAGTHAYKCTIHPTMIGELVVV